MNELNKPEITTRLLRTCAWCLQDMDPEEDSFGFGAKVSQDMNLEDKAGQFVTLNLLIANKPVFALVLPENSPARAAGHDILFITCSEGCAEELKEALELEKDVFEG